MKMNNTELLNLYKEQIKSNTLLEKALWEDCDFRFEDNIDVKNDILICDEESNYEIYPFGESGDGGVYCLLNSKLVGYISSDGACGIISKNVNDFFNLLATCKDLIFYFYKGVFDTFQDFEEKYNEINNEVNFYNISLYKKFIDDNKFTTDVLVLYSIFKSAIITEPSFILQADPTQYSQSDDLFYSEQEEVKKLRKNLYEREDKWV